MRFRYAVMSHDYFTASKYLEQFRENDYQKHGQYTISNQLFTILVEDVCKKKTRQMQEEEEKKHLFAANYKKVLNSILENDYQMAYETLQEALKYSSSEELLQIQHMLQIYFDLQKNSEAVLTEDGQYEQFEHASVMKILWEDILKLNSQNKQRIEDNKIDEAMIYSWVMEKNYKQALHGAEVLYHIDVLHRMPKFVRRLLYIYEEIQQTEFSRYLFKKDVVYGNDLNVFKKFYEALRYYDYEEAYECAIRVQEILAFKDPNCVEFKVYVCILEDILVALKDARAKYQMKQEEKEFKREYKSYIHSVNGENYDAEHLKYVLQRYSNLCEQEELKYVEWAQDLNEMILFVKGNNLSKDYFFKGTITDESHLIDQFMNALQNGDYILAYELVQNQKWLQETSEIPYKMYFILYKRLLSILMKQFETERDLESSILNYQTEEEKLPYKHLKKLMESKTNRKNLIPAYCYFEKNKALFSEEMAFELDILFAQFFLSQMRQESSLYYCYEKAYFQGNTELASQSLQKYEECIQGTFMARNVDYCYKKIQILEQDMNLSTFGIKARMIDEVKYLLHNNRYQQCLPILDEYIAIDGDLNFIGYFLRGRACERLKKYQEARQDYEKAISICPHPRIFTRLARLCLFHQEYENAMQYAYTSMERTRKPFITDLETLLACSNELGNFEEAEEYKRKKDLLLAKYNQL